MSNKKVFMSVTATAVIASALALPGASNATELSNKNSEAPWTVSLKHDLKVKEIDAKEVVKKRAPKSEDADASEKAESVGKDGSHEVVSGDTLSEIAHKYGITTEDLMAWNNLSNTLILPGQELVLNGDAEADSEGVAEELVIVEVNEDAEREEAAVAVAEEQAAKDETAREAEEAAVAEAERAAEEERLAAEQAAAEDAERAEAVALAEAEEAEREEEEEEAVVEAEAAEQAEREAEEARLAEEEAAAEAERLAEEERLAAEAEQAAAEVEAKVEEAPEVQEANDSTDNNDATVETVNSESNNADKQAEEAAKAEAAEKKAEEERVAAEKKKEEERIAAQKQKEEEERKAAEQKAEQDRIAAEKKKEEERKAAEAAAQKQKEEEERKAAEAEQSQVGGGDLISNAKSVLGTPYVWGGSQPGGFDCSGFIHWAHKESGNDIGRTSVEGYYNKSYMISNPQPGDLVFFEGTYKSGMSHMGIYLGGGQMIHAGTSTGVAITSVNGPYWGDHFHSYKRFY